MSGRRVPCGVLCCCDGVVRCGVRCCSAPGGGPPAGDVAGRKRVHSGRGSAMGRRRRAGSMSTASVLHDDGGRLEPNVLHLHRDVRHQQGRFARATLLRRRLNMLRRLHRARRCQRTNSRCGISAVRWSAPRAKAAADHHSPTGYAPNAATSTGILGSSACTSKSSTPHTHTCVLRSARLCNLLPFPLSPFYLSKGREDTSATAAKCLVVTICGATICGATIGATIHVMIETIDGATIEQRDDRRDDRDRRS